MKTRKFILLIEALFVVVGLNLTLVSLASTTRGPLSDSQTLMMPDGVSFIAFNVAKTLRHLASARRDIFQKKISSAQSELGEALTLIDEMKSRFLSSRLQELVATGRIRLTYQEPKQVLAYLELITPAFADIQEPAAAREAKDMLVRTEGFLKKSDKETADLELAALMEVLIDKTATRSLAHAERQVLNAASELNRHQMRNADQAVERAEGGLRIIAFGEYMPLVQTKQTSRQAHLDHAKGRWPAAKADLEQASRYLEHALTDASARGQKEIRNLYDDIRGLLVKSTQSREQLGKTIKGLWERGESLAERARDFENAGWERFQASSPGAVNLIEARLHVNYAETYELTTGENQKAGTALDRANSYLSKAVPQMSENVKPKLEGIETELTAAKMAVGTNDRAQKDRYDSIKDDLTRLIY